MIEVKSVSTFSSTPSAAASAAGESRRISILINGQPIFFSDRDRPGSFVNEIELEIDGAVRARYAEMLRGHQKKQIHNRRESIRLSLVMSASAAAAAAAAAATTAQQDNDDDPLAPLNVATVWPFMNVALEFFLGKRLPKVYAIREESSDSEKETANIDACNNNSSSKRLKAPTRRREKKKIKDIIQHYSFLSGSHPYDAFVDALTEADLKNIGRVKDKVNQLVKHYGRQIRKDMGVTFIISDEDQSNYLVLVSLRKSIDASSRVYSNLVPFYTWESSAILPMRDYLYAANPPTRRGAIRLDIK